MTNDGSIIRQWRNGGIINRKCRRVAANVKASALTCGVTNASDAKRQLANASGYILANGNNGLASRGKRMANGTSPANWYAKPNSNGNDVMADYRRAWRQRQPLLLRGSDDK